MLTSSMVAQAQHMQPKQYNFTSFTEVEQVVSDELLRHTSDTMLSHPEFGYNPHNTQCSNCVELLDKRTGFGRYYIDPQDANHFYVQQSYFPLHYPDENGYLRTIDPYLLPAGAAMYRAPNQPVPTFYDNRQHTPGMEVSNIEFRLNQNLRAYFQDVQGNTSSLGAVDHTYRSIGDDGVLTTRAWPKVDMEQIFKKGAIKTNFIIQQPLNLPAATGWLVFEEDLEVPPGYTLKQGAGLATNDGHWQGELILTNPNGRETLTFHRPKYFDSNGIGLQGMYEVAPQGQGYVLRVMVPMDFLSHPATEYPVYIDPLVSGFDSIGFFGYVDAGGFPVRGGANLAFTQTTLGSCDYTLDVTVPGMSELSNITLVDLEFENQDVVCVTPPYPNGSPFCRRTDATQTVVSSCGVSVPLACAQAVQPFIGTCTTDPTKVANASAVPLQNMLLCIPPQCPDHVLTFTLENRSLRCLETCDYNCVRGTYFAITQEARTIELTIAADRDTVCVGEPVKITSFPDYGVPPYTYSWSPTGQTDSIITVFPTVNTTYVDTAFDLCLNFDIDSVAIVVKPSPIADAGSDVTVCTGDIRAIGGSPTAPAGATIQWTALPPSATSLLNNTTSANPQVIAAPGSSGSYQFIVRVEDAQCFTLDTVDVEVVDNLVPVVNASATELLCDGDVVTISLSQSFTSMSWSTGDTAQSITVTEPGQYTVSVSDVNGCFGESDTVTVTAPATLTFDVFPDTTIDLGETVTLRTDIDLLGPDVASFSWAPVGELNCTNCEKPEATPAADQTYYLTVTSVDGCELTDSVVVNVILPDQYVIPSAFTPNQDGFNDRFYIIKASGVEVLEFKVFSRWGEIIHDDPKPWDGNYKDFPMPMGVYIYVMELQLFTGEKKIESGDVTLLR